MTRLYVILSVRWHALCRIGWNMANELLKTEYSPLIEKAVRSDGTIGIKVIGSGWGSSGYYSKDVLERDIPSAFPPGTFMMWNHPTATEEAERPEGDLSNLAAILTSAPKWQESGKQGPGVYADAKVFGGYKEAIDEIGEHIGVSIRGRGRSSMGEADGREGRIIDEVTDGLSVDFVTSPGAGGAITQVFEAAPNNEPLPDVTDAATEADDSNQENDMEDELKEAKDQLKEAVATVADLTAENAKLQERLLLQEAAGFVTSALLDVDLPVMTRERIAKGLRTNPPIADGKIDEAAYKTAIETAVTEAQTEIAAITGSNGKIVGQGIAVGGKEGPNLEEAYKRQDAALADLGYGGGK